MTSNLVNNPSAGLIASSTIAQAHPSKAAIDAVLIGVDLGPNVSVATILWPSAIQREGEAVGFYRFLQARAVVTPPAFLAAPAPRLLVGA